MGKVAAFGFLGMCALVVAAGFVVLGEKESSAERKLKRILHEFQQSKSFQGPPEQADSLEVFCPDSKGDVCIWCTKCFVRACPGFHPSTASENIDQRAITSCLQDHVHDAMHQVNMTGTIQHAKFRGKVKEKCGGEEMYFNLKSCINSYQNLNRQKNWIHRLHVDIRKVTLPDSSNSRLGVCVLCSRCDIDASSIFWLDEGEGTIQEDVVHKEIENDFTLDLFRMHGDSA